MFYCKKCNHNIECVTKEDCAAEKKEHKRRGCQLAQAPHLKGFILTRPQLAEEAKKGKRMVEQRKLEEQNEENNSTGKPIEG